MNVQAVLASIDAEAIARDTLDFVRVKSETGDEGAGSAFLADLFEREGFGATVEEVEAGRPNVYGLLKGTGAGPTLLLNGHTDTIPIGVSAPPGRDGDWVIGRGTEDMKGGLVAMVHAASALKKAGVRLAGDLWLTGVIGHEVPRGKKEGPRRLIQHLRSGKIHADAIVIVEGPCAIWSASLGSAVFTITVESSRGQIHTVKVPYAENPARWVGELLVKFVELEARFEAAGGHPLCGRETINVGMVHGGDYMNRLPTPMSVTGTRRWTPGKKRAEVLAEFERLCWELSERSGLTFTVKLEGEREPYETPIEHPIMQAALRAGEEVSGARPKVIGMSLVGDANLYANEGGVPTVYYGPAHETAHSDLERVSIRQLAHCAKVYALTAMHFCGVAR